MPREQKESERAEEAHRQEMSESRDAMRVGLAFTFHLLSLSSLCWCPPSHSQRFSYPCFVHLPIFPEKSKIFLHSTVFAFGVILFLLVVACLGQVAEERENVSQNVGREREKISGDDGSGGDERNERKERGRGLNKVGKGRCREGALFV